MDLFVATGMMLSPRVFMSLGNTVGFLDRWAFVWIVGLFLWAVVCLRARQGAVNAQESDSFMGGWRFARNLCSGKIPRVTAAFVRLVLFCLLTTSILALAGFSFNEVFFYQFPNMGFTFVMLAVICGVHLFNDKAPLLLQCIVTTGAILCFVTIAIAALLNSSETFITKPQLHHVPLKELGISLAPSLLIFIGFELAELKPKKHPQPIIQWGAVALLLMASLFAVFVQVARLYVPLEKLAFSSVPHMVIGRKVLGETGRYLAGGAVILGSAAAVNALLIAWRSSVQTYFLKGSQSDQGGRFLERILASVLPFCIVALLLLAGYAGEPILELWLGIAFGLYLLIYAGSGIACMSHLPLTGVSTIILSVLLAAITIYSAVERALMDLL